MFKTCGIYHTVTDYLIISKQKYWLQLHTEVITKAVHFLQPLQDLKNS